MNGFSVGDYVIADRATDDTFEEVIWVITKFGRNLLGQPIVRVRSITRPNSVGTSFYPHELSFEDGSRPSPESGS